MEEQFETSDRSTDDGPSTTEKKRKVTPAKKKVVIEKETRSTPKQKSKKLSQKNYEEHLQKCYKARNITKEDVRTLKDEDVPRVLKIRGRKLAKVRSEMRKLEHKIQDLYNEQKSDDESDDDYGVENISPLILPFQTIKEVERAFRNPLKAKKLEDRFHYERASNDLTLEALNRAFIAQCFANELRVKLRWDIIGSHKYGKNVRGNAISLPADCQNWYRNFVQDCYGKKAMENNEKTLNYLFSNVRNKCKN